MRHLPLASVGLLVLGVLFACQSRLPADDIVIPGQNDRREEPVATEALASVSRLTSLTLDPGNATDQRLRQLRLYTDNCDALAAKRVLVRRAQRSIDLAVTIFDDDEGTLLLVDDIIRTAQARPELKVRVLVDFLYTYGQIRLLEYLDAEPNIEVRRFRPPHREFYLVLDEHDVDRDAFVLALMRHDLDLAFDAARDSRFGGLVRTIESGDDIGLLDVLPVYGDALEVLEEMRIFLKRMHAKLLLVDDEAFVMGGRNLNDLYHAAPGSDVLMRRGLSVEEHCVIDVDIAGVLTPLSEKGEGDPDSLQRRFFDRLWFDLASAPLDHRFEIDKPDHLLKEVTDEDFERARSHADPASCSVVEAEGAKKVADPLPGGLALPGAVDGRFLVCNTSSLPHRFDVTRALIDLLDDLSPGDEIDVISAYLMIDVYWELEDPMLADLDRALVRAAGRGAKVRLWTNSFESTDLPSVNTMALESYARHLRWGIEIHELAASEERLLHAKAIMARRPGRGDVVIVGSYNVDPRSHIYDVNIALEIPPSKAATAAADALQRDVLDAFTWIRRDAAHVDVKVAELHASLAWLSYIRDLL